MKNIIVLHHSADFDGLFCREIARKFLGDTADYLGWDYGDPIPFVPDEAKLYMLDISVDGLMGHPNLTWIDHHKTAIEKYPATIRGLRIDGVAACRLAWQWFFRDSTGDLAGGTHSPKEDFVNRLVSEPYAVRLAGEYDIWDKRDPNTDIFQQGLRSLDLTMHWAGMFRMDKPTINEIEAMVDCGHQLDLVAPDGTVWPPIIYAILANGRVLDYSRKESNVRTCENGAFEIEWEGLRFLALNAGGNSLTFASAEKPEHDGLLMFRWAKSKWKVSLYHSQAHKERDLSVIAAKFGGGGHRGACGFECQILPFLRPTIKQSLDNIGNAMRADPGPYGFRNAWLANIAMPILDQSERLDLKTSEGANAMAVILLKYLFEA